ncbi:MAG: hypothetical protein U5K56_01365 [Halioglobus sp.]|nr:hypothetical protein [Halioglobus sp.]
MRKALLQTKGSNACSPVISMTGKGSAAVTTIEPRRRRGISRQRRFGIPRVFDKSSKSLMRMFGPKGNPQASNLFAVIRYLQEQEGIHLEVKARKVA